VTRKRRYRQEPRELPTIVATMDISSQIILMKEEMKMKATRRSG
jgi:hypothetical protein